MSTDLTATPTQRDVVLITGEDAPEYVQSQITQDVLSLARGRSRWSFILTPRSEIESMVRVTRTGEGIIVDVAPGNGDRVRHRLDGPLFRMDVRFAQDTWPGIAWRGDGADSRGADSPIQAPLPWQGSDALDEVGPDVVVPSGFPTVAPDELDAIRIRAHWPSEAEIDDKATPAMTGIVDHTVSFDKGCYTGQEFVARVHYRQAAPPRQLVHLGFETGARVTSGDPLYVDGDAVGTVTSVQSDFGVGLAYCKRSVMLPARGTVGSTAVVLT